MASTLLRLIRLCAWFPRALRACRSWKTSIPPRSPAFLRPDSSCCLLSLLFFIPLTLSFIAFFFYPVSRSVIATPSFLELVYSIDCSINTQAQQENFRNQGAVST